MPEQQESRFGLIPKILIGSGLGMIVGFGTCASRLVFPVAGPEQYMIIGGLILFGVSLLVLVITGIVGLGLVITRSGKPK